jgi:hypothetical protein
MCAREEWLCVLTRASVYGIMIYLRGVQYGVDGAAQALSDQGQCRVAGLEDGAG